MYVVVAELLSFGALQSRHGVLSQSEPEHKGIPLVYPEWFRILIDNNIIYYTITVGLLKVFPATVCSMK